MSGIEARDIVERAVCRELFGPAPGEQPKGKPLDTTSGVVHFADKDEAKGQFHDETSGEEILRSGTPLKRYGVGVLYSGGSVRNRIGNDGHSADDEDLSGVVGLAQSDDDPDESPVQVKGQLRFDEADSDDFDLADANSFKPSAMALSFECYLGGSGYLEISVNGARYESLAVHLPGYKKPVEWWVRRPFMMSGRISTGELLGAANTLSVVEMTAPGDAAAYASVYVYSRRKSGAERTGSRLLTVALVNDAAGAGPASALFQVGFDVQASGDTRIEPYPDSEAPEMDNEEKSIELLYRNQRTYAIGHGCAADWNVIAQGAHADIVTATALPAHEVTSLSPDVYLTDLDGEYVLDEAGARQPLAVSMRALADGRSEGAEQVEAVLEQYENWIRRRIAEIADLPVQYRETAHEHMARANAALSRMREGWQLVQSDPLAMQAFRWTNEAMLYQQIRSGFARRPVKQGKGGLYEVEGPHPEPSVPPGRGTWRPFQIAFVLSTIPELVDKRHENRSLVDLIFFPTGGGKTEAYLGAAAFSLLARRLRDPDDAGTDTLMRYTLRLLTAQQFLRAAALVCVLEDIRERNSVALGLSDFGIGIWLGGSSTPNTWDQAAKALSDLKKPHEQNRFLLLRCPWCGTQMGPIPKKGGGQEPIGYHPSGKRVVLRCIDPECKYSRRKGLPVHVVDEDIYEVRPSIVIGTVDKFAMMAWRPAARQLFGIDDAGSRSVSPPSLIIQDELHLISGPLGSMVGLYEPIIDALSTDNRTSPPTPPKIVASTATVRRYEDQIRGLFGREHVALFPPHGLEEGHSFFAEPAVGPDGMPKPGRKYLGVMSASLGSTQTVQVRVAAATLQAGAEIPEEDRDGYWTNLNFLNSLRELGNTVSLLQADVPDYLTGLKQRDGIRPRWPRNTMELTSRRRSDEIPKAIEQLQVKYPDNQCIDICLASNIIEVGVDIDRLGLMTIVGQPKTTAQYIQVSGRVGRKPEVSPGLVITVYGAAKPRDRSHYERFRTYHQQLYAQVEPTSVTPFATPVLKRALHAAAVAYIRQTAPSDLPPSPFPAARYDEAILLLRKRAEIAEPTELDVVDGIAAARAKQWAGWERTEWDGNPAPYGDPQQGLMRFAGTLPSIDSKATIWDVPTSMRNVDAECRLEISQAYVKEDTATGDLV